MKGLKINCVLIHPKFSEKSSLNYTEVCRLTGAKYPIPPLGLLTVAALLPFSWNLKLVDLNTEPFSETIFEWADLVFTGGMLSQQTGILELIEKSHLRGKRIVVGGPDPTCQPELYADADYLIIGEGENTLPSFLDDWSAGIPKGIYKAKEFSDMSLSMVPRYDLIRFSDYLMMGMQFSRGCPYRCEFCNVIELFGRKQRAKTAGQIIRELQFLYEHGYRGHVFFVDDNFLANGKPVEELLTAIARWSEKRNHPFYFQAETSVNFASEDILLGFLRDAGFRYLSIGLETPEDNILEKAQKQQNMHLSFADTVRKVLSYGMVVDASFILGFDNETGQTACLMTECIQDSGICMAMIGTLYALPNTQLAERLKCEGRLFREDVLIRDSSVEIDQMTSGLNFRTIRSRTAILRDYIYVLENIYHPEGYFKRLLFTGLYLKTNNKYQPDAVRKLKNGKAFIQVCRKLGFNHKTGNLYWKLLFRILIRNPKALEIVVSFAAMYIHLAKHAGFIIDLTKEKIKNIESIGEENYNRLMLSREECPGVKCE